MKVFHNVRANYALTVLAAAGSAAVLTACNSNEATYRPAPHYTSTAPQPTYTQPAPYAGQPAPTYTQPAQPVTVPPKPAGGGGGCGGGKCG